MSLPRAIVLSLLLLAPLAALAETTPPRSPPPATFPEHKRPRAHQPTRPEHHPPVVRSPAHSTRQKPAAHPAAPHPAPAPAPVPAAPPAPAYPTKGTVTGLKLPRFASLRSDEVNLRAGPGTQYPIDWVYKRRELPVEIVREFDVWRLIIDQDGVRGWVNQATLMARRSFVVTGAEQVLRAAASDTAAPVARLQQGVMGRLRSCAAGSDWCQVRIGDYSGWLKRDQIWGALAGEVVQP